MGEETNNISTREDRALVFVDVRNPVLIGSWDELGEGTTIPGPLNPGWDYSKRWKDSRDDWDDDEEEDACSEAEGTQSWEGSMSEREYDRIARETIEELAQEKQPSLPVVLAQMVNEYHEGLTVKSFSSPIKDSLTKRFNDALCSAAQPFLTEHLDRLLNRSMVVKWDMATGPDTPMGHGEAYTPDKVTQPKTLEMYEAYVQHCKYKNIVPFELDEWTLLNEKIERNKPEGFRGNVHSARKPE